MAGAIVTGRRCVDAVLVDWNQVDGTGTGTWTSLRRYIAVLNVMTERSESSRGLDSILPVVAFLRS
jgi:hypothetical protein